MDGQWTIRIRKLNLDLVPRSCKYTLNHAVCRIGIPKIPQTQSGFNPKILQKHSKPGSLEDQDPKSEIFMDFQNRVWSQNTGADKIMEIQTGYAKCSPFGKINVDLAPKSCKFTVDQLVWRIRIYKLNLGWVPNSCKYMQTHC